MPRFLIACATLTFVLGSIPAQAEVRVALYSDSGSKHGGDRVQACLEATPGLYRCFQVTASDIRNGALANADVLVQGGGSGSKQGKALGPEGCEAIRQFVQKGGGYLGICAGAYLASAYYPWSLHIINTTVIDRKHWNRGAGMVQLRLTSNGKKILGVTDDIINCYYHQGPLLGRAHETGLPPYDLLAAFQTGIAKNGASPGVMEGTTAIAAAPFGQGKVICISPHPEKTDGLGGIIEHAVHWIAPKTALAGQTSCSIFLSANNAKVP